MTNPTHQQAAIRHLAGRLAAEIAWPNPTLLDPPERLASHLIKLVCDTDISIGVPALAVAGPLITQIRGYQPDVDLAAAAIREDSLDENSQLGHDIGIGFCRSVFNADTVDRSVTFFVEMIGDPALPQEQKNSVFMSALGTVLTVYATAL